MKTLIAAIAIVPMIAGCDIVLPGRTFQTSDILCTRGNATFQVEGKSVADFLRLMNTDMSLQSKPQSADQLLSAETQLIQAQTELVKATHRLMMACGTMLSN